MDLLYDAQTSGGLLMFVPEQAAERTVERTARRRLSPARPSSAAFCEKSKGGIIVAKKRDSAGRTPTSAAKRLRR